MKIKFRLPALLSIVLTLAACGSGSDKVTGSVSLTDNLDGKYSREYQKKYGSSFDTIRDTILIVKKDNNFEVANHRWFKEGNKPADGFSKVHGFDSFQGTFNKVDTTISHPLGGSLKFDLSRGTIYMIDKPDKLYTKVK